MTSPQPASPLRPARQLTSRLALAAIALVLGSCGRTPTTGPPKTAGPRTEGFNRDWRFAKGSQPGAEAVSFDDSAWQPVRLPHDWAIAGPYEPKGDPGTGKLPWKGEGWYRKSFRLPAEDEGRRVYLDFDGVMAMPVVYVNGQPAGGWDYGYMSFRTDATKHVRFGDTNLVAVHVDTRQHHSRWYPGAGIYRRVQLAIRDPVHIANWGIFVTTPEVGSDSATVQVEMTLENHSTKRREADLEVEVLAPDGNVLDRQRDTLGIESEDSRTTVLSFRLSEPQLWDISSPALYKAITRVTTADGLLDTAETPFGIRTFEFTADDGFHLNGRRVQLHGVNLHHDLGPMGTAFNTRAMERQLEIMRDMGVNALRTSHNPPAPEVLDLCDRLGILVWDEVFDKWDDTATLPEGVSIADHGAKQIVQMIRRDRNHPSVVVWSVGNEVWDLELGKYDDGPGLLRQMVEAAKSVDTTRPVTLGHCVPDSAKTDLSASLDVTGWNYARRYAISREIWPELPIVYSESASALSTRGYYHLPHPEAKDDYPPSARISSYDHNAASYSDIADTEFALMEQDQFVAGEFVWTGFDYLGEPYPYYAEGWGAFPKRQLTPAETSRSSSYGIVDLVGIPKDRYFLYRSHWAPDKATIHILPHWNWPDKVGENVPVYVYTNGDSAELFINGISQEQRSKDPVAENVMDRYRLRWEDTVYEPGEVRAVAYRDGRKLGEATVRTAGQVVALRLTPDRDQLEADGDDLAFVLVEAIDANGTLDPLAMHEVKFTVSGPATIAGVGNGDHHFPAEFDTDRVALFYGKAIMILRTVEDDPGEVDVRATSEGLQPGRVSVRVGRSRGV